MDPWDRPEDSRYGPVQRYCDVPLPGSRYVPGQGPHPRHGADPHLPEIPTSPLPLDPRTWRASTAYRYAIDLFNREYFWEAHEVLEGLWAGSDRTGPTGRFLQSLIQISAALLKETPSGHAGARRLFGRAVRAIGSRSGVFLGVDVEALAQDVKELASGRRTAPPRIRLELRDTPWGGTVTDT